MFTKLKSGGFFRTIILFATILSILPFFTACNEKESKPTLLMVCHAAFPPYELVVDGEIVGIDPEIIREICKRNGYELKIENMAFGALIAAVQTGKADVAASGITVTEERKQKINFTDSYIVANQRILIRAETKDFKLEDLKNKPVGVQEGTTGDMYVKDNFREPERYKTTPEVIQALKTRKVYAAVLDNEPAEIGAAKNPDLQILSEPLTAEEYAFAISKERSDLLKMFNNTLRQMKYDGTLEEIKKEAKKKYSGNVANTGKGGFFEEIKTDFRLNFIEGNRYRYLLNGFGITLLVTIFSVLVGLLLGFLVAVTRSTHDLTGRFPFLDAVCRVYLTVIRGTPVVVQLLIIYFVIFGSVNISKIIVAIVAFGFNSGAYVAEIIRAGIMSLDNGQFEAGRSLGLSYRRTMLWIILPQALKNVLPALGNEFIVLLKETSVAGFIALEDLTKGGDIIRSQTYNAFLPLMAVALIYLAVVMLFSFLLGKMEKKLKKD